MTVIENLAHQESEQTPPAARIRERIDDVETVVDNLCVEAANGLRVLDDQLTRANNCSRQLAHEWLAFADRSAANLLDLFSGVARAQNVTDWIVLPAKFGQAQAIASNEYWKECCRLATATAAECSQEK